VKRCEIESENAIGLVRQRKHSVRARIPHLKTQLLGVINPIVGGFAGRGSSNLARKCYVRNLKSVNLVLVEKRPIRILPPITFMDEDFEGINRSHNDPMVVKIEVANFLVCKVLLDNRSSIDVLYWLAFKQLGLPKSQIEPFSKKFIGFAGETMDTIRYMHLLTTFEDEEGSKSIMIKYLLVDTLTFYNILI